MTPEEEAKLKEQSLAELRQRHGDEYMEKHAKLHEAQWGWAKQLGFLDPETDLVSQNTSDRVRSKLRNRGT